MITNGPNTNGISIYGFKMIGRPNIQVHLCQIMKVLMLLFPLNLKAFVFDFIIRNTRPNVRPDPLT